MVSGGDVSPMNQSRETQLCSYAYDWKLKDISVGDNGKFSKQVVNSQTREVVFAVKGKFKAGGKKAKGTVYEAECSNTKYRFTAVLQ